MIERKLESLRRRLARIRDIGAHRLTTAAEAPPATKGETFSRLAEAGMIEIELASRLRSTVGFRKVAVLNDQTIDWAIVHAISLASLHDFEDFARAMLRSSP